MGGYGSTRWAWHNKKTTVEDCHRLTIYALKPYLQPWTKGHSTWTRGNRQASIGWLVTGSEGQPEAIRFIYTITDRAGVKTDHDYPVRLTWTMTPWGARRYWFTCPLAGCGRRVGALYLPPGGRYFGCRHCYKLTYTKCQESGKAHILAELLGPERAEHFPFLTDNELEKYLECSISDKPLPRRIKKKIDCWYFEQAARAYLDYLANPPDLYPDYLTPDELRAQSGLTPDNLAALEAARLLLPDHGGRYRPKLAGWARKLATLLGEGWTIDELKAWARGRWSTPNPRAWPPERDDWSGNRV